MWEGPGVHMALICVGCPYLGLPPPQLSGGGLYVRTWVGGLGMMEGARRAGFPSE